MGRCARRARAGGFPGQPDPVDRAHRARRRRRDRSLPRRGVGTRLGAGRLAADAVLPRTHEHRTRDHDRSRALRLSPDRCEARLAADQTSRRQARPDAGACGVLLRELEALSERLAAADVQVVGALRPGTLASTFRVAFDPWSRPGLARLAAADPGAMGSMKPQPGRPRTENSWGSYRTESAFHATYWISGWPRIDVGAAFLSPLLLHAQMVRAYRRHDRGDLAVKAIREVEAARTSDIADRDLRGSDGLHRDRERATADRRSRSPGRGTRGRACRAAVRRAISRFPRASLEGLERHCSEIEHAAQMARLELLRLYGQQEEAFTYTLPLCRGLR